MAHYAFLDESNIVTQVIPGNDEGLNGIDWEQFYSQEVGQVCKRTSFNTYGGQHKDGGIPYRKNYAGIGFIYDENRDAFIPPQPYPSWTLNENSCLWEPLSFYPNDEKFYEWDELNKLWVFVSN
jgi:hypothetical protein